MLAINKTELAELYVGTQNSGAIATLLTTKNTCTHLLFFICRIEKSIVSGIF